MFLYVKLTSTSIASTKMIMHSSTGSNTKDRNSTYSSRQSKSNSINNAGQCSRTNHPLLAIATAESAAGDAVVTG